MVYFLNFTGYVPKINAQLYVADPTAVSKNSKIMNQRYDGAKDRISPHTAENTAPPTSSVRLPYLQ